MQDQWYYSSDMSRSSFDIVTIGDCMLDVFVMIHEASVSCRVDRTHCLLSLPYGEKVPVEDVIKIPGAGNASNAAVGFARLGCKTAIVSTVGHDEAGQMILARWREEGVATHLVTRDKKRDTNYSTVLSFRGERTILVYHQPYIYRLPILPETTWIYYSSLGKGHELFEQTILRHLARHPKTRLTFNPGTHQLRRGIKALRPIIARSEVFIVNKEEAEFLLACEPTNISTLLRKLFVYGMQILVITDGKQGASAMSRDGAWHCPSFPGKEVERTGAGDSFATAFSFAQLHGNTVQEALRYGTAQAWSVIQYIGPQAGLMHQTKIERILKQFAHMHATSIL